MKVINGVRNILGVGAIASTICFADSLLRPHNKTENKSGFLTELADKTTGNPATTGATAAALIGATAVAEAIRKKQETKAELAANARVKTEKLKRLDQLTDNRVALIKLRNMHIKMAHDIKNGRKLKELEDVYKFWKMYGPDKSSIEMTDAEEKIVKPESEEKSQYDIRMQKMEEVISDLHAKIKLHERVAGSYQRKLEENTNQIMDICRDKDATYRLHYINNLEKKYPELRLERYNMNKSDSTHPLVRLSNERKKVL